MTKLRIKELCKKQGITQATLATKLGIKPISFSQAVNRNNFDMNYLSRIADCLGVSIPELFEQQDSASFVCPRCGARLVVEEK